MSTYAKVEEVHYYIHYFEIKPQIRFKAIKIYHTTITTIQDL